MGVYTQQEIGLQEDEDEDLEHEARDCDDEVEHVGPVGEEGDGAEPGPSQRHLDHQNGEIQSCAVEGVAKMLYMNVISDPAVPEARRTADAFGAARRTPRAVRVRAAT